MTFLDRFFRRRDRREALAPLHRGIVALARDPGWYRAGGVPDTLDGRFDMIAAATALVLLRLEGVLALPIVLFMLALIVVAEMTLSAER